MNFSKVEYHRPVKDPPTECTDNELTEDVIRRSNRNEKLSSNKSITLYWHIKVKTGLIRAKGEPALWNKDRCCSAD